MLHLIFYSTTGVHLTVGTSDVSASARVTLGVFICTDLDFGAVMW
jgi:hypothetical protein